MSTKVGENPEFVAQFYNEIYPAAQKNAESAQHSLQQMYGAGAEQICSACCYAALCHFHNSNPRVKGCAHYYG